MSQKITQSLKNFFIPNLQNQLRPYSLRFKTLSFIALVCLVLELVLYLYVNVAFRYNPFLSANVISGLQSTVADFLPEAIAKQINEYRIANGANPLVVNQTISYAAFLKANDMSRRGYFSHRGPDGEEPWVWFDAVGYQYSYAGENLAVNFFDARDLVAAWIKSPSHRINLLSSDYSQTGIGISKGTLDGHETLFVVQFFASPLSVADLPKVAAEKPKGVSFVPPPAIKPIRKGEATSTQKLAVATATEAAPTSTAAITKSSSTEVEPTSSLVSYQAASVKMTPIQEILTSPRYFVQNIMIVLLAYILLVLFIPMLVIFISHRSPYIGLRIREIFMLFSGSIRTASLVAAVILLVLFINYLFLGAGVGVSYWSIGPGQI